MTTYRIDLQPAYRRAPSGNFLGHGKALMSYQGQPIGESRQPLFAAARWLLDNAHAQPGDRVATYRDDVMSMSAPVGAAAAMTVSEPDRGPLRFDKWEPYAGPRRDGSQ